MTGRYEDIIHLSRPVSRTHPPMPITNRAAQFSPFAALTGHNAAIREVARYTHEKIELDEQYQDILGRCLLEIQERGSAEVKVTYFCEDKKKEGGEYVTVQGQVVLCEERQYLIFDGKTKVPFADIVNIEINN